MAISDKDKFEKSLSGLIEKGLVTMYWDGKKKDWIIKLTKKGRSKRMEAPSEAKL